MPEADQPGAEAPATYEKLKADIESAPDSAALMVAVATAEKTGRLGVRELFGLAQEIAASHGDREVALMYGNRLAAELNQQAAKEIHEAADTLSTTGHGLTVTAESFRMSAEQMYHAAHAPR